ncbi:MAG: hypothetical protein K5872_15275 [Rhizobiaceae bacterium]|nr:hypothetical protein [Rhizobiaceae bacterium]MCV0407583.1 hypothetical protein [Rhizobiaceae bacterium]
MRTFMPVLAALLIASPVPTGAQDLPAGDMAAKPFEEEHAERLDELFRDLKRERNERAAERISQRIWREWFRSGSATVDLMMHWSEEATKEKKFDVALDFLDQAIVLKPGYAEAWNRRATVHFMMDSYSKAMSDIERTLRLEPRHFGALTGMASILKETGEKELALRAYERVLEVYPMMRAAQEEVGKLADELAGDRI